MFESCVLRFFDEFLDALKISGFARDGLDLPVLAVRADEIRGERMDVKERTLDDEISFDAFEEVRVP